MTDFFVHNTQGNDGDAGTALLPWKTVSKVSGETSSAGDSIFFKKGEVWREELVPPSSGGAGTVTPTEFERAYYQLHEAQAVVA